MSNNGVAIKPAALKAARLAKGWTLRDVAVACGEFGVKVDYGNVSRYERGRTRPYPKTLLALATVLDGEVADFTADEPAESAA